jgi:MFS family permease
VDDQFAALGEAPPGADRPGRWHWLRSLAVDVRPLRESPAFRRMWLGQAVSFLGSQVTFVAVPYQLYSLTGSTLQVGLLSLCELVPLLTLSFLGGAFADAVDRRRLVIASDLGLALASGLLAANASLAHPHVWALYVLSTLVASLFALGLPALRSLTPSLVAPDRLPAAFALGAVYGSLGMIVGPTVGGALIGAAGLTTTYLLDVGTFAASLAAVASLPAAKPEAAERVGLGSIVTGLRFLGSQPAILGSLLLDTNAMVFGMPQALFPALAAERFAGGAQTVGLLYAAPAVGSFVAALLSGWAGRVRRQGIAVAAAASAWGVAIALFGLAEALWLGLLLLAVAGAADMTSGVFRSAILLGGAPDELRGRLTGIELAQVASAPALGNVEAGPVATLTSLRFSIVSGGLACVAGCALLVAALPGLRSYEAR